MSDALTFDDVHVFVDELREMARRLLSKEGRAQSLQPTALLLTALRRQRCADQDWNEVTWDNRNHFFSAAYRAMDQALIDHARGRNTKKSKALRSQRVEDLQLSDPTGIAEEQPEQFLALFEALEQMKREHPRWVELIQHRYHSDLTIKEAAHVMDVAETTVGRWWRRARLLLHAKVLQLLNEEGADTAGIA